MAKRYRNLSAKPNQLLVGFGRESRHDNPDIQYCYPENECFMSRDVKILMHAFERCDIFGKTMREHLIERGYDITTIRFTIEKLESEQCQ